MEELQLHDLRLIEGGARAHLRRGSDAGVDADVANNDDIGSPDSTDNVASPSDTDGSNASGSDSGLKRVTSNDVIGDPVENKRFKREDNVADLLFINSASMPSTSTSKSFPRVRRKFMCQLAKDSLSNDVRSSKHCEIQNALTSFLKADKQWNNVADNLKKKTHEFTQDLNKIEKLVKPKLIRTASVQCSIDVPHSSTPAPNLVPLTVIKSARAVAPPPRIMAQPMAAPPPRQMQSVPRAIRCAANRVTSPFSPRSSSNVQYATVAGRNMSSVHKIRPPPLLRAPLYRPLTPDNSPPHRSPMLPDSGMSPSPPVRANVPPPDLPKLGRRRDGSLPSGPTAVLQIQRPANDSFKLVWNTVVAGDENTPIKFQVYSDGSGQWKCVKQEVKLVTVFQTSCLVKIPQGFEGRTVRFAVIPEDQDGRLGKFSNIRSTNEAR